MREEMAKLAAPKTVKQALDDIAKQHTTPEAYLDAARKTLEQATSFVREKGLVTLSARSVRPDIQIVARGSDTDAEKKLKLAGADRVVMPYTAAGRTMANLVLKPQVTAFLDAVTTATGPDLHMAEIEVHGTCANAGKSIREIRVRHHTGAIIVALRKRDGTFDTTPEPDAVIESGDVIVGVGTTEELQRLEDLFARRQAVVD